MIELVIHDKSMDGDTGPRRIRYTALGIEETVESVFLFTAGFRTQLLLCVKRPVGACCKSTVKLDRSALFCRQVLVSVIFRCIKLKVLFCQQMRIQRIDWGLSSTHFGQVIWHQGWFFSSCGYWKVLKNTSINFHLFSNSEIIRLIQSYWVLN